MMERDGHGGGPMSNDSTPNSSTPNLESPTPGEEMPPVTGEASSASALIDLANGSAEETSSAVAREETSETLSV